MSRLARYSAPLLLGASSLLPLTSQASVLPTMLPLAAQQPFSAEQLPAPTTYNGQEIFQQFRNGLANPACDSSATSAQWKRQYRHAAQRLSDPNDNLLPLFGYVVNELHKAGLPSEFALIPFVESGYRADARSKAGPAGLWQFIASTARSHRVPMGNGMDGRLSVSESTDAAVAYLGKLHTMFNGNWELATMGYNAGEYRILQSMRKSGLNAATITSAQVAGLSPGIYRYVEKLHALSCVLEDAADNGTLMAQLDRDVPILTDHTLAAGERLGIADSQQAALVQQINPLTQRGKAARPVGVLVPLAWLESTPTVTTSVAEASHATEKQEPREAEAALVGHPSSPHATGETVKTHVVRSGESLWTIARRHGIKLQTLLSLNDLTADSTLRPGTVLQIQHTLL